MQTVCFEEELGEQRRNLHDGLDALVNHALQSKLSQNTQVVGRSHSRFMPSRGVFEIVRGKRPVMNGPVLDEA